MDNMIIEALSKPLIVFGCLKLTQLLSVPKKHRQGDSDFTIFDQILRCARLIWSALETPSNLEPELLKR